MVAYYYENTLLEIENVCLEYDGKPILKNVNAVIKDLRTPTGDPGQVVGFLGPSGIGKTQLFRIMAGLKQPTSGQVYIRQCNCGRPDCKKDKCAVTPGDVGVVAQNYPLFQHRTVMANLILAAKQKEKDPKVARDKVLNYLNEFELTNRANLYPAQLSGGQRQRCAILQQILCSEHFLLMDEPFSGLDLTMLEKTAELIQKIANMDGLNTIIVVTHDITAAASVADTLWLMGRDKDAQGNVIPGARIVETYDLIKRELCWQPGIITQPRFLDFVREVKDRFRTL
jgi:ABC-type nitrate/sulfonate/bicarbonate transport system ATPase subunit